MVRGIFTHSYMINKIKENLIPKNRISDNPKSQFQENENLNIAIKSASQLGIKTVNIGATDIREGNISLIY